MKIKLKRHVQHNEQHKQTTSVKVHAIGSFDIQNGGEVSQGWKVEEKLRNW